jgi:hypothetical protein
VYNQNQLTFMTMELELGAERVLYSEDFPYIVRDDVSTFLQQCGLAEVRQREFLHGAVHRRILRACLIVGLLTCETSTTTTTYGFGSAAGGAPAPPI